MIWDDDVMQALRTLYRTTLSYSEIARELGCTKVAVQAAIRRMRAEDAAREGFPNVRRPNKPRAPVVANKPWPRALDIAKPIPALMAQQGLNARQVAQAAGVWPTSLARLRDGRGIGVPLLVAIYQVLGHTLVPVPITKVNEMAPLFQTAEYQLLTHVRDNLVSTSVLNQASLRKAIEEGYIRVEDEYAILTTAGGERIEELEG